MSAANPCYRYNTAIVRTPCAAVVHGLRATDHGDPDYSALQAEHGNYIAALEAAGLEVLVLPELESLPDSVFVEDPAVVFTQGAVLLRSAAQARRAEGQAILPVLHEHFDTVLELPHGHVDGGDVLVTPRAVLIGISKRTDAAGAAALAECLAFLGLKSEIVHTPEGVLHFKTECSLLDEETVLATKRMVAAGQALRGFRTIMVPDGEEPAANVLRINASVLVSAKYQRTREILENNGYSTAPVQTAEIEKIDAGLSCMSLRWLRK